MRNSMFFAAVVSGFCCTALLARTPQPALAPAVVEPQPAAATTVRDLSSHLDPIIKKHNIPGMVAGIVVGDRLVAAGAAGIRKRGAIEAVTVNDQFHLGSCTKAMTATLCAILVERGTLQWNMTLAEVFPELTPRMHDEFKPVTLSQLLSNRGGVPGNLDADGLWGKLWKFEGDPVEARQMLLEGVVANAPDYPPGTKNIYSNGGFAIAGHMAETVSGKAYEELMQELLFEPLGMTECGWGAPGTPGKVDQPRGHRDSGKPVEPRANGADNPPAITPAGRLHCTLADWSKFVAMHLRGDSLNPSCHPLMLQPASFDKLHTPPDTLSDYAFGWRCPKRPWAKGDGEDAKGNVLSHSGSNTMWYCVTWIAPERDFAVLVMCNQGERGDKACDEAASALIQDQLSALQTPTEP